MPDTTTVSSNAAIVAVRIVELEGKVRNTCTLRAAQQAHAHVPPYLHPQHAQSGWPAMPATLHLAGALAWTAAGAL